MSDLSHWLSVIPPLEPAPYVPVLVGGERKGLIELCPSEEGIAWQIRFYDGGLHKINSYDDFRYDLGSQMGFLYCLWLAGRRNSYSVLTRFFYTKGIDSDRKLLSLAYGGEPTDEDRLNLAQLLRAGVK